MRTIVSEIAKRFLVDAARELSTFEKRLDDLLGIVRAPGVTNAIAIDPGCHRFQQPKNDVALVFHNHIQAKGWTTTERCHRRRVK